MKIVFFGTPAFASNCLHFLLDHGLHIIAVVTQPDRPQGRSLQVTPSAVKTSLLTRKLQIPIFQPEKASEPLFLEEIAKLKPDLFVVVVFGQLLPQKLLDIPRLGSINVHPSLLPKFRGAAPIRRALMEGERETGVVIQKMIRQMDAGNVLAVEKVEITPEMNHGELEELLLEKSKPLLLKVIQLYEKGEPLGVPQEHEKATFAPKISTEEGEIRWEEPAEKIHNKIRALSPKPGAWAWVHIGEGKKRLKILRSKVVAGHGTAGEFFSDTVVCGSLALQLLEVQPEGKKVMSGADWFRGIQKNSKIFTL
jgi:methionyl-tRNA formyltransferase